MARLVGRQCIAPDDSPALEEAVCGGIPAGRLGLDARAVTDDEHEVIIRAGGRAEWLAEP